VDLYRTRVRGEVPRVQYRVCTKFKPDGVVLPHDAPHAAGYPFAFIVKAVAARVAMMFGP
jgi:hypothetical protein